jgi:hypothetical protein
VKQIDPKKGRAIARATAALLGIGAIALIVRGLILGAGADRCAGELAAAAARHDVGYLDRAVKSPSARDVLASAHSVDLGFVRPLSSEWSRIGLFVKRTETSSRSEVVLLRLSSKSEVCEFLRDYDSGPFEER